MENIKFTVLGGDHRNIFLAKLLMEAGHSVSLYGFDSYGKEVLAQAPSLYDAITGANYIIGPTPCSHSGTDLNTLFSHKVILLDDVFRLIKPHQYFFAGHLISRTITLAKKYNVRYVDILKREELALLNAIPTAEGAIKLAIENTNFTLHDAKIMVIGYGRIGKILCKMLNGIGAYVYPVVKTREQEAQATSFGYNAIMFEDMERSLNEMQIIYNTVPQILIDSNNVVHINKDSLIIDLSSQPHGIDYNLTEAQGLKVLFTGSLPGKIAPLSTAGYMMQTILNLINEL